MIDGEVKNFLLPQWGLVKPFALEHPWQFRPEQGPAGPGDADFARQMDELVHLSAGLTDEQKMICEFWLGGPGTITPPGIWCDIAQFVSRRDKHADWQDVMMFFALTNALYDASIAAWDAKRKFDTVRPITAIRLAYNGKFIDCWAGPNQGTQNKDGAGWLPEPLRLFATPRRVVLVPDRRLDGTNLMSFPLAAPLPASYGAGSFRRHLGAALASGVGVEVVRDRFMALDIDHPSDLTHPLVKDVLPAWLRTNPANPPAP